MKIQVAQRLRALLRFRRQITVEGETLADHARGHQRQQDGGGAHQGADRDAVIVRQAHQFGAGVGHGGTAGLGQQAHVEAVKQGAQQAFEFAVAGVLVEFQQGQLLNGGDRRQLLEEGPGGLGVFDDEGAQAGADAACFVGQHPLQRAVAQGRGNQVEGAGSRFRLTPFILA